MKNLILFLASFTPVFGGDPAQELLGVIEPPSDTEISDWDFYRIDYEQLARSLTPVMRYDLLDSNVQNPLMMALVAILKGRAELKHFKTLLDHQYANANAPIVCELDKKIVIRGDIEIILFPGDTLLHVLGRYADRLRTEDMEMLYLWLLAAGADLQKRNSIGLTFEQEVQALDQMLRDRAYQRHFEFYKNHTESELRPEMARIESMIEMENPPHPIHELRVRRDALYAILAHRFNQEQERIDAERERNIAATNDTHVNPPPLALETRPSAAGRRLLITTSNSLVL